MLVLKNTSQGYLEMNNETLKCSYTVALVQCWRLKTFILGFNDFRIDMEKFKNNYINYSSLLNLNTV